MTEEKTTQQETPDTTKLPAELRADMLSGEDSMFLNVAKFEQGQRIASLFANSTMVPEQFQRNIGNCMIALNYASRLDADPFMVMQNIYVVNGRPGIESQLVTALVNRSKKYSQPLKYQWLDGNDKEIPDREVYADPKSDERGCRAWTIDAQSGEMVYGPKVTWKMVHGLGWYDKKGPDKTVNSNFWRNMPEVMFTYRSGSWFCNKHCPELKLGMMTVEELHDVTDLTRGPNGTWGPGASPKDQAKDITDRISEDGGGKGYTSPDLGAGTQKPGAEEPGPPDPGAKKDAQDPDTEKTTPETPLYDEWSAIRSSGYEKKIMANLGEVEKAQVERRPDYEALRDKWFRLYPDKPWPLDPKASEAAGAEPEPVSETEPGQEEPELGPEEKQDKVRHELLGEFMEKGTDKGGWNELGLPKCPKMNDASVPATRCYACDMRVDSLDLTICPALQERLDAVIVRRSSK